MQSKKHLFYTGVNIDTYLGLSLLNIEYCSFNGILVNSMNNLSNIKNEYMKTVFK